MNKINLKNINPCSLSEILATNYQLNNLLKNLFIDIRFAVQSDLFKAQGYIDKYDNNSQSDTDITELKNQLNTMRKNIKILNKFLRID